MEENRFKRAYLEYQREKEEYRGVVPRNNAGRFECLRDENYVSYPTQNSCDNRDNRFLCLGASHQNNNTIYLPRETFGKPPAEKPKPVELPKQVELPKPSSTSNVVYLPRPTPKVETQVKPSVETWKPRNNSAPTPAPPPPPVTFESNYHFPDLLKANPKSTVVIPESKKEMITKPVIVPIKKPIMTRLSMENGKLVQRDMFEDGTEIPETGIVMVKKPNYTSWASVLKPETTETVYYDLDDKKIINFD
jgi:hypothetical protein